MEQVGETLDVLSLAALRPTTMLRPPTGSRRSIFFRTELGTQVTADRSSMVHPAAKELGEPEEPATRPRGVRVKVHGSSG